MAGAEILRDEAARRVREAASLHAEGAKAAAIEMLRHAVDLYATAGDRDANPAVRQQRASACRQLGEYLTEASEHAEAANVYQEAADLFHLVGTPEAEAQAHGCAQAILAGVEALHSRPTERLYLLVAHHERRLRQLALEPGTIRLQAECCVDIARIFLRRERYPESIPWFEDALARYERANPTLDVQLGKAECHHRLALLTYRTSRDLHKVADHYRKAIELYSAYEPVVHGEQSSLRLCMRSLAEVEQMLREPETSPDA
jgi:tetratricopeptide (TPR) repeat protein